MISILIVIVWTFLLTKFVIFPHFFIKTMPIIQPQTIKQTPKVYRSDDKNLTDLTPELYQELLVYNSQDSYHYPL